MKNLFINKLQGKFIRQKLSFNYHLHNVVIVTLYIYKQSYKWFMRTFLVQNVLDSEN
jgi:hypothetical protein